MPKRKLTNEDVAGIRYGYNEEEMSLGVLAAIYGVSRTQIWRIVNRKQHNDSVNGVSSRGSDTRSPKRVHGDLELLRMLMGKV